MRKPKLRNQNF